MKKGEPRGRMKQGQAGETVHHVPWSASIGPADGAANSNK
jgi:hypothetical protein